MRETQIIVSDSHGGLKAARMSVFGGVQWRRCQFHLAQNDIHHAPTKVLKKEVGEMLRAVWGAPDREAAETALAQAVQRLRGRADKSR